MTEKEHHLLDEGIKDKRKRHASKLERYVNEGRL
jgi:hypothetical protein